MDMMKTFEDEFKAETSLIAAYIGCGDFLKAEAADETRRSTDINHWIDESQLGNIEEGLCNYEAAIPHYREVFAELQKQEYESLSGARGTCLLRLAGTLIRHSTTNRKSSIGA